ncbi:MAG: hypothetical protein ACLU6Y_14305 [Ruminococcus sp.]
MALRPERKFPMVRHLRLQNRLQYVDYPEAENLNQYNQPDILRLHTAGAKLLNKVLSTETGGTSAVYGTSWQELLDDIYVQYAGWIPKSYMAYLDC